MKRTTKVWLIAAASLVLIGCLLFAGVLAARGWDFSKLSTVRYETNTHVISEPFSDIALTTDTADIVLALSDDGIGRVECREEESARHSVAVEDGTLVIKRIDTKAWHEYIGFRFGSPKITVYLPKTEYNALFILESTGNVEIPKGFAFADVDISLTTGDVAFAASVTESVKIKASTGNIRVENMAAGSLDLSVTTGKVTVSGVTGREDITIGVSTGAVSLNDISCRSIISRGTTGSISLDQVTAAERFSIERSTGDVQFSRCDAAELYVKTNTGNVTGSLLTDKVFVTDTDTGRVEVPQTAGGGRCEIRTNTGDIKIEID